MKEKLSDWWWRVRMAFRVFWNTLRHEHVGSSEVSHANVYGNNEVCVLCEKVLGLAPDIADFFNSEINTIYHVDGHGVCTVVETEA